MLDIIRNYHEDHQKTVLNILEEATAAASSFCFCTTLQEEDGDALPVFCIGTSTVGNVTGRRSHAGHLRLRTGRRLNTFSGRRPSFLWPCHTPILTAMRALILVTALFCALISGWTASLARVQDLGGLVTMHHAGASAGHGESATSDQDHCTSDTKNCDHHPQGVHPLLCAACFAVVLDSHDLDRDDLANAIIRPRPQKPLQATALEPQFPPPKTLLSVS